MRKNSANDRGNDSSNPPREGPGESGSGWRLTHLGRLLGHALRRFDERVLQLMASDVQVPPIFCISAMTCSVSVVLPDDSGP